MRICPKCLRDCHKFTPRGICTDCYDSDDLWKRDHASAVVEDPTWIDLKKKWDKKS